MSGVENAYQRRKPNKSYIPVAAEKQVEEEKNKLCKLASVQQKYDAKKN